MTFDICLIVVFFHNSTNHDHPVFLTNCSSSSYRDRQAIILLPWLLLWRIHPTRGWQGEQILSSSTYQNPILRISHMASWGCKSDQTSSSEDKRMPKQAHLTVGKDVIPLLQNVLSEKASITFSVLFPPTSRVVKDIWSSLSWLISSTLTSRRSSCSWPCRRQRRGNQDQLLLLLIMSAVHLNTSTIVPYGHIQVPNSTGPISMTNILHLKPSLFL